MNAIELTKRDQKIDFLVRKAKILVVDDQKSHRLLLKTLLARVGHEVLLAESAEEAFECLGLENPEQKGHGIELVLMDLQMQGVNGIEACARIKLEPHLKNIPLVIVTTETVEKYISTVMQCGSAGFIRKPICEAELLANVALVLNWVDETQKGQRITEALTCSNKRLNEFAAIASHDLMEPLRKITCFGGLLLDKYNEVLGDEGQDYLARMINAAERMQKYTSNLLNYAHVRDVEPAFSRIDLRRVAQEVVEDLSARIEESGGTITLKYLPTIVVSNFMMQQLFQNLLANALKFHRPNVAPKITLDAEKINGHGWTIVVSDNGIGFDDADLAGMLNPFKQLNAKSQFDGMGMGLAICDEIVRAHGGSLAAQSVPGEGTSFLITLPDRSLEMAGGVTNE